MALVELYPFAHTKQAETIVAGSGWIEAEAIVFHDGGHSAFATYEENTHAFCFRVLYHIRQGLLNDPVQRRLHVSRQPVVAEPRLEIDGYGRCLRGHLYQPLERGYEPEVVKRFGPELHSEPPHVLQSRYNELAHVADRLPEVAVATRVLDGAKTQKDRRQRLPCFVVELAGKPA